MTKPEETHEEVGGLVELAGIYLEDGAPRAAAERLRKAADLCDRYAAWRDATLTGETA